MDEYTNHTCPSCGETNYVCQGDPEDFTSTSGSSLACECWSCKIKFLRPDDQELENWKLEFESEDKYDYSKSKEDNLKDMYPEKGLPAPDFMSLSYVTFLDAAVNDNTWRGLILGRLALLNNGRSVYEVQRAKRVAAMNKFIESTDLNDQFFKDLCKGLISEDILGESVANDIKVVKMRIKEVLDFMFQI